MGAPPDWLSSTEMLDEEGLRLALTELLGIKVDVVVADTLRGEFRERILAEAIPI
ncbi:hypothetical protein ACSDQ9_13265 [Aestuariimicrobium soli]|uniref:hypothetical protein n=1 Tax=Aestuariimicrobium soli TaxID=2035834 RepID=UPI003EB7F4B7